MVDLTAMFIVLYLSYRTTKQILFLNQTKPFVGCIEIVKSTISQKLKIEKLIFHSFQNIMHHKDHIIKTAFFEGEGLSADRYLGNAQIFLHFFNFIHLQILFFFVSKCSAKAAEHQKKKQISNFSNFYFSSYGHFCSKNCQLSINFHDNSRNKIRQIVF